MACLTGVMNLQSASTLGQSIFVDNSTKLRSIALLQVLKHDAKSQEWRITIRTRWLMEKPFPRCAFGKHLRRGTTFPAFFCLQVPSLFPLLAPAHLPFVIADLLQAALVTSPVCLLSSSLYSNHWIGWRAANLPRY